jgi:hypothetical protein
VDDLAFHIVGNNGGLPIRENKGERLFWLIGQYQSSELRGSAEVGE